MNQWRKVRQWARVVRWVERRLIPTSAELNAGFVIFMVVVFVARVGVLPDVLKPVISLKQAVVFDDPVVLLADVGSQNRSCELRMIGRRENITNIVQQGASYGFVVRTIPFRACCGLQAGPDG